MRDTPLIESGVPLPDERERWLKLLNAMRYGDSVVLPSGKELAHIRKAATRMKKKHNDFKLRTKVLYEDNQATGEIRVWKIKNETTTNPS